MSSWMRGAVLAGIVMSGLSHTASAALSDGLIGYWKADGNGADTSGGGRDVSLIGGLGFGPGLFGQAFDYPGGAGQYAVRPEDDAIYQFGLTDFTLQAWVNYDTTSGEQVVLEKWYGAGGPGWTFTKLSSNAYRVHISPSVALDTPGLAITSGVWHQLVVRREGGTLEIWFDDAVKATRAVGATPVSVTAAPLLLGRRHAADGRGFGLNGRMDEVAIWDRALNGDELGLLFNDGAGTEIQFAEAAAMPEPAMALLAGLGLAVAAAAGLRRRGRA